MFIKYYQFKNYKHCMSILNLHTKKEVYIMQQNNFLTKKVSLKDVISLCFLNEEIKDIGIDEAYDFFLNYKRNRVRPDTIKYYNDNIPNLLTYLHVKGVHTLRSITKFTLSEIANYYQARNNKNISINKKIGALLAVIHFAENNELITPTNLKWTRLPEQEAKIEIVKQKDAADIMEFIQNLKPSSKAKVELILSTGIRMNELCHIEIRNIHFEDLKIYLSFTKNGEPRYTAIPEEIAPTLKAAISEAKGSEWLFPNSKNTSCIKQSAVKSLMRRIKAELHIDVLSSHKLRHLYATTLLKRGVDIKTVSRLLGHKSIRMTERYIDIIDTETYHSSRINNPLTAFKK